MVRRYHAGDFDRLFKDHEGKLIAAFVEAANRISNNGTLRELQIAIATNDFEQIARLLGLDPSQFEALADAIDEMYYATAQLEFKFHVKDLNTQIKEVAKELIEKLAEDLPSIDPLFPIRRDPAGVALPGQPEIPTEIRVQFDRRNMRAETYLREQSGTLIREITEDQRAMIREVLETGMSQGRNPRDLATILVGKIDKISGRRNGGMIGLTQAQSRWVMNGWYELDSGDYSSFLRRGLVDKRSERTIRAAIANGRELTPEQIQTIMNRYQNSMLKLRAETIARTEMLRSQNAAKYEAALQAMEASGTDPEFLKRQWKSAHDARVRDTHVAMNNQTVTGMTEPFVSPDNHQLMYPGDTSLGAPAEEVINCRCMVVHEIDYTAMARRNGWIT